MRTLLACCFLALLIAGCGGSSEPEATPTDTPIPTRTPRPTPTPEPGVCSRSDFDEGIEAMSDAQEQYKDAFDVASASARISIGGPISDMQAAKRAMGDAEVPDCMLLARLYMEDAFAAGVDAFLAFQGQDPQFSQLVEEATTAIERATDEINRVRP